MAIKFIAGPCVIESDELLDAEGERPAAPPRPPRPPPLIPAPPNTAKRTPKW